MRYLDQFIGGAFGRVLTRQVLPEVMMELADATGHKVEWRLRSVARLELCTLAPESEVRRVLGAIVPAGVEIVIYDDPALFLASGVLES